MNRTPDAGFSSQFGNTLRIIAERTSAGKYHRPAHRVRAARQASPIRAEHRRRHVKRHAQLASDHHLLQVAADNLRRHAVIVGGSGRASPVRHTSSSTTTASDESSSPAQVGIHQLPSKSHSEREPRHSTNSVDTPPSTAEFLKGQYLNEHVQQHEQSHLPRPASLPTPPPSDPTRRRCDQVYLAARVHLTLAMHDDALPTAASTGQGTCGQRFGRVGTRRVDTRMRPISSVSPAATAASLNGHFLVANGHRRPRAHLG